MPIDASIPYRAGTAANFSLGDIMRQSEESAQRDQQLQLQQQQAARQQEEYSRKQVANSSLADLIKSRRPDGSIDTRSPQFSAYADSDAGGAFEMLGKLDTQQREHVKAGLADMAAAVQWADTPEKWAQVVQHYSQFDPTISQYDFGHREGALVKIGQMGDYLKANKHEFHAVTEGGSAYDFNPATGASSLVIGQNPGNQQQGAPMQGMQAPQASAPRPAGMSNDQLMAQAYEAVKNGASYDAVFRQLQAWGVNP